MSETYEEKETSAVEKNQAPAAEEKTITKSEPVGGKNSARPAVQTSLPEGITVYRHKIVHNNIFERNSRSVGVAQIRLLELGYSAAGGDKRGFLGDDTLSAFQDFQKDNKLSGLSYSDEKVVKALFAGTPVVVAE